MSKQRHDIGYQKRLRRKEEARLASEPKARPRPIRRRTAPTLHQPEVELLVTAPSVVTRTGVPDEKQP